MSVIGFLSVSPRSCNIGLLDLAQSVLQEPLETCSQVLHLGGRRQWALTPARHRRMYAR